ncbi:MAG: TA system VapC family ribonuclease toxin [Pseudolysinimonas sp.]
MRSVDTNILVHAYSAESPRHDISAALIDSLAASTAPWAIAWPCIHEFFGAVTRRSRFPHAPGPEVALAQIEEWLSSPSLMLLSESRNHWATLSRLVRDHDVTGPVVHDAKIAAICLDNGVDEFVTFDRDFSRFPELKVRTLEA